MKKKMTWNREGGKAQYSVEKNTNSSRMLTIDDRAISLSRYDAKKKVKFLAFCIPMLLMMMGATKNNEIIAI